MSPKAKANQNPLTYLFSKTWRYSAGNRRNVVWFWIMFIVANSISLFASPLIWAKMMDVVQKDGITSASIKVLLGLLALTLVIEIIFWILHGPARLIERGNAFKARANYRKHLLKGVMTLPLEWHAEHHSGDTIDKIEKGTGALYNFSADSFEIIYAVVELLGSYAMLAYFSPPAAYIVFAMILITAWITMRFDKVLVGQYGELNHSENQISESVFDAVSNIATIVILRVEKLVFGAIAGKIDKPFEIYKSNSRLNELKWFMTNMCCALTTAVVLGVYFWQNLAVANGILIGNVYLLIKYLDKISQQFFRFTGMYGDILQRKAKVMNAEELAKDFRSENFTNHVLPENWRRLDIKGLNFSYQNGCGSEQHLSDISLSINRGERIALVGKSGSGKTTLLKIVRDLYHPKSLELSVDGKIVPSGFEGIARAIALVPQSPEIFATTILENITLGAEYEMEFVRRFTDMARFTDVAESLPKKFDSSIKEKGVNLSGGQQQRLALSRGLLACNDKDIVLLDEPTNSLDVVNEMEIYGNIFRQFQGKSIISSVHGLHLLPLFDRIYMFDGGRIVGSGSLQDLLSNCSEFLELWEQSVKNQHAKELSFA